MRSLFVRDSTPCLRLSQGPYLIRICIWCNTPWTIIRALEVLCINSLFQRFSHLLINWWLIWQWLGIKRTSLTFLSQISSLSYRITAVGYMLIRTNWVATFLEEAMLTWSLSLSSWKLQSKPSKFLQSRKTKLLNKKSLDLSCKAKCLQSHSVKMWRLPSLPRIIANHRTHLRVQ